MTTTSSKLLAELRGGSATDFLPTVVDDLTLAIDHEGTSPDQEIPPSAAIWVGNLRRIGAKKLTTCGLSVVADDAQLLISELVTNALQHGTGNQLVFHLTIGTDAIVMAVSDGSPDRPEVRTASVEEESGRGMFLIDALADTWGVSPDGTTTWCVLPVPASTRKSRTPRCSRQNSQPP